MARETAKTTDKAEQSIEAIVQQQVQAAGNQLAQHLQAQINQIATKLDSKATGLDQLMPAYIKARMSCTDAVKNAQNPHLRNTYADLGSVLDAVIGPFLENGLWLIQSPGEISIKDGKPYMTLVGFLGHASGQAMQFKMELPAYTVSKSGDTVMNPQTAGSAISYARRYMWAAVAGITQVDDDADAVSYIDSAKGPATSSAPAQPSAPQKSNGDAEMMAKIQATSSMDELKALRTAAMALQSKKVSDAYMAQRDKFQ